MKILNNFNERKKKKVPGIETGFFFNFSFVSDRDKIIFFCGWKNVKAVPYVEFFFSAKTLKYQPNRKLLTCESGKIKIFYTLTLYFYTKRKKKSLSSRSFFKKKVLDLKKKKNQYVLSKSLQLLFYRFLKILFYFCSAFYL